MLRDACSPVVREQTNESKRIIIVYSGRENPKVREDERGIVWWTYIYEAGIDIITHSRDCLQAHTIEVD